MKKQFGHSTVKFVVCHVCGVEVKVSKHGKIPRHGGTRGGEVRCGGSGQVAKAVQA